MAAAGFSVVLAMVLLVVTLSGPETSGLTASGSPMPSQQVNVTQPGTGEPAAHGKRAMPASGQLSSSDSAPSTPSGDPGSPLPARPDRSASPNGQGKPKGTAGPAGAGKGSAGTSGTGKGGTGTNGVGKGGTGKGGTGKGSPAPGDTPATGDTGDPGDAAHLRDGTNAAYRDVSVLGNLAVTLLAREFAATSTVAIYEGGKFQVFAPGIWGIDWMFTCAPGHAASFSVESDDGSAHGMVLSASGPRGRSLTWSTRGPGSHWLAVTSGCPRVIKVVVPRL